MKEEHVNLHPELRETTKDIPSDVEGSDLQQGTATSDGSPILESDADNAWEHQLSTLKQRIEELQENYDQSYLEIGGLLIQVRNIYKGHGNWIGWLKENVPFSVRHAQRLIRVAEMFDDTTLVSRLGLTASKAYILTRVSKSDLDYFLHTLFPIKGKKKSVKAMTRRELELVVTAFLRGKLTTPNHEETTSSQGKEIPKESIETNLKKLREVLGRTVASIKGANADTRESWISALEELYLMGLEELAPASK